MMREMEEMSTEIRTKIEARCQELDIDPYILNSSSPVLELPLNEHDLLVWLHKSHLHLVIQIMITTLLIYLIYLSTLREFYVFQTLNFHIKRKST